MRQASKILLMLMLCVSFAASVKAEEAELVSEDYEMLARAGRILDSRFVLAIAQNSSCPNFSNVPQKLLKLHYGVMVENEELGEWLTIANIYGRVKYASKNAAELVYLGSDEKVAKLLVLRSGKKLEVQIFSDGHMACTLSER